MVRNDWKKVGKKMTGVSKHSPEIQKIILHKLKELEIKKHDDIIEIDFDNKQSKFIVPFIDSWLKNN